MTACGCNNEYFIVCIYIIIHPHELNIPDLIGSGSIYESPTEDPGMVNDCIKVFSILCAHRWSHHYHGLPS